MQQDARAAMYLMTREIRMAGYDPLNSTGATIRTANVAQMAFDSDGTAGGGINPKTERLTALDYDLGDLTAGDHLVFQDPYTVSWTVVDDTPVAGAKRITVTADGPHRRARPISIDFIKAR